MPFPARPRLPLLPLVLLLASCGGGAGSTAPPVVTPPQSLSLSGDASQVLAGGKPVTLTATTAVAATVNWSLDGPGKLSAASGGSVTYSPPADGVSANTPVLVKASAGDLSQAYRLTLYPDPGAPGLRLLAGTLGSTGNLDGSGADARFSDIRALAPDRQGNVYLLDNGLLRRVDALGQVSTLAPTGILSVSVSPEDMVYLLAYRDGQNVVLKLLADGSTVPFLSAAQVDQSAFRLLAAGKDQLYMVGASHVVLAGATGSSRLAGTPNDTACADGAGASAHLGTIEDAVLGADGNLLLQSCASVRKMTPAGVVTTLAGRLGPVAVSADQMVDGSGTAPLFGSSPATSLSADKNGNLRLLDAVTDRTDMYENAVVSYRLRQVSAAGAVSTLAQGSVTVSLPAIEGYYGRPRPYQLVRYLPNGKLLVASAAQLWLADDQGKLSSFAGNEGDITAEVSSSLASARFYNARSVSTDLAGNIYVLDDVRDGLATAYKIAPSGAISQILRRTDLAQPNQLLSAADGSLYLATRPRRYPMTHWPANSTQIYKLGADGVPQLLAGSNSGIVGGNAGVDGSGAGASFFEAELIGLDGEGNLYVRDTPRYRKITPQGVVTTVASLPAGVGAAPDGYRYEVDRVQGLVYRLGADGGKTVVAGTPGREGNRTGALPGSLVASGNGSAPAALSLAPAGPGSFVLLSGGAILKLVLPH